MKSFRYKIHKTVELSYLFMTFNNFETVAREILLVEETMQLPADPLRTKSSLKDRPLLCEKRTYERT